MRKLIVILTFLISHFSGNAQELQGTWNGNLEVQPGRKILFIFRISGTEENLKTEIAIPGQGVNNLIAKTTTFKDSLLTIDASNVGFRFTGNWDETYQNIEGTFQEGVNAVPLTLSREAIKEVKLNRPQEPLKPYPYLEEEVRFRNEKANITLAGTLTIPKSENKKPAAVILISGSGPQDRNESFATHKPFLVLADYLTRKGIAVLRYDDRGFGESTGNFYEGTTADFASDVLSAVSFLKERQDIDPSRIGLIGHSEGAIIAPMAANLTKDVNFIVMLAGTAIPGREVSFIQARDLRNFPVTDEKEYETYVKEAIEIAASDKEISLVRKELTAYYQNSKTLQSLLPAGEDKNRFIENLVATRTAPWIRYFYNYNPTTEIHKISVPALALYGSNDMQVPPKYHFQSINEALQSNNSGSEVVVLEGLNHLFQESKTGHMAEYAEIEQTISPAVLERISTWISKQTK